MLLLEAIVFGPNSVPKALTQFYFLAISEGRIRVYTTLVLYPEPEISFYRWSALHYTLNSITLPASPLL